MQYPSTSGLSKWMYCNTKPRLATRPGIAGIFFAAQQPLPTDFKAARMRLRHIDDVPRMWNDKTVMQPRTQHKRVARAGVNSLCREGVQLRQKQGGQGDPSKG